MARQAEAPLLARQADDDDFDDFDDFDETPLDEPNAPPAESNGKQAGGLGYFVWLLTLSAGISGLLFGCTHSFPSSSSPSFIFLPVDST